MKLCVFGAGAIGGYVAARLALSGVEVCAVARGAHLDAMKRRGLVVRSGGQDRVARFPVSDCPDELGVQDTVICTLKAHQAFQSADLFAPLLGKHTAVLTAMNGVPWWYFYKSGSLYDGHHLDSVDPGGRLWTSIGPERAIGCVVEPACEIVEPGIIEHHGFNRFILGEPDGKQSNRVNELSRLLTQSGLEVSRRDNIRWNIWLKLLGNVCLNPLSLLTCTTVDRLVAPGSRLRSVCESMMYEGWEVARAFGIEIPEYLLKRRLDVVSSISGHKISMLQDLERGRELEIDAIVTAVQELGRLTGKTTPTIDLVLALIQERGYQAGLYKRLFSHRQF